MGEMRARRRLAIVDFSGTGEQEEKTVSYIRKCLIYALQVVLKNRIYPKDQPLPPDHKNWL
jgi:N-glycosylase/DNA lyase